jgi:MoaA/NifB/PqqE/SkfB family radical SAM enzyme
MVKEVRLFILTTRRGKLPRRKSMDKENKQVMWRSNTGGGNKTRRHMLKDVLPLDTPVSLDIEAAGACCLKCAYCPQSLSVEKKKELNIGTGVMEFSLFEKMVDECTKFPNKLKSIRFAGFGEPLLNSNLAKMVQLVKEKNIAESVIIFTNGLLLTHDLSEKLVEAGVDTFLIDIQGTNADDYLKYAGTRMDFANLMDNLSYLHGLNQRGKIFIKTYRFIVDKKREEFFQIFEPVADEICIENIYEINKDIDYTGMITEEKEVCGVEFFSSQYCPLPFYAMSINAHGLVTACCLPASKANTQLIIGDLRKQTVKEIWEGTPLNDVRKMLLEDRTQCKSCEECKYTEMLPREDLIDEIVEELKQYCNERKEKNVGY